MLTFLLSFLVVCTCPLQDTLPYNDYFEYFGPDYRLHLPVSNMENLNSVKYLEDIKYQVLQVLDGVEIAPGTQIHTGQDGTTLIPSSFPHSALSETTSSSVRDSSGLSIMSNDRGGGQEDRDRDRDPEGVEGGNSMDGDRREDEAGGRPEHPSEFYTLPAPSSLTSHMDVSESPTL